MSEKKSSKRRPPGEAASRVQVIARRLRDDALSLDDGEPIGSEEDLVVRYGISRPTLRQAASLVAQEQLVYVRRGVGGGYFARRPQSRSVAHMASIYFRARQTTMEEVITAVEPIRVEICRLAARSADDATKERLARFVETRRDVELAIDPKSYREFLAAIKHFGELTATLSGNEPLHLFQNILYDVCAHARREEDLFAGNLDRMTAYHSNMIQLSDGIVAGDEQLALLAGIRSSRLFIKWIRQDLGLGVDELVDDLAAPLRELPIIATASTRS